MEKVKNKQELIDVIKIVEQMNNYQAELCLAWFLLNAVDSEDYYPYRTSYGYKHDVECYFGEQNAGSYYRLHIDHDIFKEVAELLFESKPAIPKYPENPNRLYKFIVEPKKR